MKTTNLSLSKKILLAVFMLCISFSTLSVRKVSAQMVVSDPTNLIQNTITAGSAPMTASAAISNAATSLTNLSWNTIGKNTLDALAYAAAQNLLTQLTQNTITWIRGGFHGSPSFAVDTNQVFTEIADNVAGGMVLSLRNISVCEFTASYKDDLINSVDLSVKKRPYLYNQQAKCPFKENASFKASDFYNNFSNGGWSMMSSALNDGGNPYGLQLITAREQASREAAAKDTKDKKLAWSNGFMDIVDTSSCNYPPEIFYAEGDPDPDGSGLPLSQWQANEKNKEILSDPARAKALQDTYCKTTTPGKIVGDQLTQALGVDVDRIGFADNMNKIVSAFLDTFTQKAIRSVFGSDKSTAAGGKPIPPLGNTQAPLLAVSTSPATNIGQTTATLNGFITYAGAEKKVRVWFVLGETSALGDLYPATISTSLIGQNFSSNIAKLKPNTTYFVNVVATTGGTLIGSSPQNEITGAQLSFKTLP